MEAVKASKKYFKTVNYSISYYMEMSSVSGKMFVYC